MLVDEVCFILYDQPVKMWFYLCERAKKEINLYPCLINESKIKRVSTFHSHLSIMFPGTSATAHLISDCFFKHGTENSTEYTLR